MNVHRIRFLELEPKAITCLAFSPSLDSSLYLAVGRSDGSIEIWSHTHGRRDFSYRRTIPGTNDSSITCLNWSGDRLFSAGLTGVINEWGVSSYTPTQSASSVGGAIWSMDVNIDNSTLAVGCEDGQVH
jgi:U3 small nucleolar RNA-associated protein 4